MLQNKVREIVTNLTASEEFQKLKEARRRIEKNSLLKNKMDQYFHANAEAYGNPAGHSENSMRKRFEEITSVPEIAAYFEAGHKFDKMVVELHHLLDDLVEEELAKKI